MKLHNFIILALIASISIPTAAGVGYATGAREATITPGQTHTFTVYLYGDGPITLSELHGPKGWDITVDPATITPGTHPEPRYIPSNDGAYRRAAPTTVSITPPLTAAPDTYRIEPVFAAETSATGGSFTVQQTLPVTFRVTVTPLQAATDSAADQDDQQADSAGRQDEGADDAGTGTGGLTLSDANPAIAADEPDSTTEIPWTYILVAGILLFEVAWIIAVRTLRRR